MSMTSPPLLIVVPVHEEEGWCASPGDTAKARLEAKSPSKSPEEILVACQKANEKAQALHQLHVDAVRRRAQRDLERVAEAERRRLRNAAAEKQRIVEKAAQKAEKQTEKKEAIEAQAAEKRARREALKAAFFEARTGLAAAAQGRVAMLAERHGSAAAKRTKLLQATVNKANYEVKHALAVATAAKEKERAAAAAAGSSLDERLAAAASRRTELRESPPKSPGKESSAKKSSRARARQVAQVLNDEAVAIELKRVRLAAAMDKALQSRNARLEATVQRAAAYKEKAARAKAALEARQASVEGLAHTIVEKAQAADVRRAWHLKSSAHRKLAPVLIEVALPKRPDAAPAALVARLSTKPTAVAEQLVVRHQRAAAAREQLLSERLTAISARAARADAARFRRAVALDKRRAKSAAQMAAAAQATASAMAARTASARQMNLRVRAAVAKRMAHDVVALGLRLAAAEKRDQASAKRAALLAARGAAQRTAATAAAARRAAADKAVVARGEANAGLVAKASERRVALLSARVAKAKMSAIGRSTAVKLSTAEGCGVVVKLVPPSDNKTADGEASLVVPPSPAGGQPEEKAKKSGGGLLGRMLGGLFGA